MSAGPVICLGQQPCGFFPRRFLYAKLQTARRVQAEIGGEIVLFLHDSDHDPRETQTIVRHRHTGQPATLNFTFENRLQRKWSPLHLKRVPAGWQAGMARQLGAYVSPERVEQFKSVGAATVADFCLEFYRRMGLLEGIRVVRSSDPAVRRAGGRPADFFVDVPHEGEVVRARWRAGGLQLHEGGDSYVSLPATDFTDEQVTPARDTRLPWMQAAVQCTHYVAGAGEQAYLRREDAPEITFVDRDPIDRADEAYH